MSTPVTSSEKNPISSNIDQCSNVEPRESKREKIVRIVCIVVGILATLLVLVGVSLLVAGTVTGTLSCLAPACALIPVGLVLAFVVGLCGASRDASDSSSCSRRGIKNQKLADFYFGLAGAFSRQHHRGRGRRGRFLV
ncbi:hypothetical protein [Chlamydia sp. 17-3921]|uniref:hypothetical protein n=1 Tax=Chlamydia sp. 17-3921 TaxID=2675798 RepID=UPI00191B5D4F|nr:hypothetical protein [Chlamydia sp. 17-3921]